MNGNWRVLYSKHLGWITFFYFLFNCRFVYNSYYYSAILWSSQVLKLYAWEKSFMSQVSSIRKDELRQLKNAAYLNASFAFTFTCAPFMVSFC